jgi:hypothetical protein
VSRRANRKSQTNQNTGRGKDAGHAQTPSPSPENGPKLVICYCRRLSGKSKCLLNNSSAKTAFFDRNRRLATEFA